jgi:TolA-binding protein
MYSAKRYKEALEAFGSLADEYECNYLSAYWAGMASLKLKDNSGAAEWFDLALTRRPTYKPALDERAKIK